MFNLVLKDILIQKKSLATAVFFAIIMIISFQSSQGNGAYIVGALAIVFLLISGAFAYDKKNRGDVLINSLSVNRRDIVMARYISLIVFSIIAILIVSFVGMLVKITGLPLKIDTITLKDVAGIYIVLIFMFSIYIPIYFKFGYMKSRLFNVLLYLGVFIISGLAAGIGRIIAENSNEWPVNIILPLLSNIPDWMIGPLFILVLLTIIIIKSFRKKTAVY